MLQVEDLRANYGPPGCCTASASPCRRTRALQWLASPVRARRRWPAAVGLHTSWTGEMMFEGARLTPGISDRSKDTLRGVQYIFQNPYASLNPRRTIGGLLAQPLEHFTTLGRRERDHKVVEAIQAVSMSPDMLTDTRTSCQAASVSGSRSHER